MKISLAGLAFLLVALAFPFLVGAEFGLGPPFSEITVRFLAGESPVAGVNAILVDGAVKEQTAVSGGDGRVSFLLEAPTGNATLTFWKEGFPPARQAIPYVQGNHYRIDVQLPEAKLTPGGGDQ